jgi:hypothetical protein
MLDRTPASSEGWSPTCSGHDGPFGVEVAGAVPLPRLRTRLATTTFDDWLADDAKRGEGAP